MTLRESENVELKEIVVEEIKKEIIAFANCEGGKLYIGVADDGQIVGVDNTDKTIQQISNMVRDNIKPDVTMFLHYETLEENHKNIVIVNVQRGTNRPYYLAKKGLRPEGVYVRQGTSSVPATDTAIRMMIKETDGDSFEEMRSLNQELTFNVANNEFITRNLLFEQPQKQTLNILSGDGVYTNLGLLLSEQCMHTIKVACFQGTDQSVFKDRREFSGSLLQQMNEVYDYVDYHNKTQATFDRLRRIETRDYPEIAVREALLNLLVHRDYSFRASGLVSIYEDRIEFISVGGLLPGVGLNDVLIGVSVCRNPNLANVFYRLELIEAYGTGLQKIMSAYKGRKYTPKIETSENAFKIILPNINYEEADDKAAAYKAGGEPYMMVREEAIQDFLDTGVQVIFDYLRENRVITRSDVERLMGVSTATAYRYLKRLVENGYLIQRGRGKNVIYMLA